MMRKRRVVDMEVKIQEEKMYRFTVSNGKETFSWQEEDECWEGANIQTGEWRAPFPNEPGNSMAFGLVENFEQGRYRVFVRGMNYVKIERIPEKAKADGLESKVEG